MSKVTKEKMPYYICTGMIALSIWMIIRAIIKYTSLWLIQLGYDPFVIPFIIGDPLSTFLHIELFFSCFLFIATWLISTKITEYQSLPRRIMTLLIMVVGILSQMLWNASTPIVRSLIPFIYEKKRMVYLDNYSLEQALLGNTDHVMLFILSLPLIFTIVMSLWIGKLCEQNWNDIIKEFKTWEYSLSIPSFASFAMSDEQRRKASSKVRHFFEVKKEDKLPLPDVELGMNIKTKEMVVLPGKDRTLNNLIIGAIGTGKTSAILLPMINQDLHHMSYMINHFPELYTKENYHSEDIKGALLNGISVIEPSKDLCDKTYELALAHGIPKEAIYYIDPTNPKTPSLNLFNGPVDKVSEMFAMVIDGIGENTEFFFQQSQRDHLKMHIYLLMLHEPGKNVGFEELIDMYNNAQLVYTMHNKFKQTFPENINNIKDKDERNHWLIAKGVDSWFDEAYSPETTGFGANASITKIEKGEYRGQPKIIDTKSEHVMGLRNILNDIASNILMRRVLFGKSDFNFDRHLEYGGILLVNTAKGDLSKLSDVLGKFTLLSLQNAVFRRKPNVSAYHSLYVDEFPDYINEEFASFPAQSRKYKAIVTVVAQTVSQLSRKYGPDFMTTLIATLRNKYLYGDSSQQDSEMFSAIFGEKIVYVEGESDQEVSPLMESPVRRTGLSYQEKERAVFTPNELIYQDAFVCAVKIVKNNKPLPAQQVLANFVPKDEFKTAVVQVEEEKVDYWLKVREESFQELSKAELTEELIVNKEKPSHNEQMILDQSLFEKDEKKEERTNENKKVVIKETPSHSPVTFVHPLANDLAALNELENEIDVKINNALKFGEQAELFDQDLKYSFDIDSYGSQSFIPEPSYSENINDMATLFPDIDEQLRGNLPTDNEASLLTNEDELTFEPIDLELPESFQEQNEKSDEEKKDNLDYEQTSFDFFDSYSPPTIEENNQTESELEDSKDDPERTVEGDGEKEINKRKNTGRFSTTNVKSLKYDELFNDFFSDIDNKE